MRHRQGALWSADGGDPLVIREYVGCVPAGVLVQKRLRFQFLAVRFRGHQRLPVLH